MAPPPSLASGISRCGRQLADYPGADALYHRATVMLLSARLPAGPVRPDTSQADQRNSTGHPRYLVGAGSTRPCRCGHGPPAVNTTAVDHAAAGGGSGAGQALMFQGRAGTQRRCAGTAPKTKPPTGLVPSQRGPWKRRGTAVAAENMISTVPSLAGGLTLRARSRNHPGTEPRQIGPPVGSTAVVLSPHRQARPTRKWPSPPPDHLPAIFSRLGGSKFTGLEPGPGITFQFETTVWRVGPSSGEARVQQWNYQPACCERCGTQPRVLHVPAGTKAADPTPPARAPREAKSGCRERPSVGRVAPGPCRGPGTPPCDWRPGLQGDRWLRAADGEERSAGGASGGGGTAEVGRSRDGDGARPCLDQSGRPASLDPRSWVGGGRSSSLRPAELQLVGFTPRWNFTPVRCGSQVPASINFTAPSVSGESEPSGTSRCATAGWWAAAAAGWLSAGRQYPLYGARRWCPHQRTGARQPPERASRPSMCLSSVARPMRPDPGEFASVVGQHQQ